VSSLNSIRRSRRTIQWATPSKETPALHSNLQSWRRAVRDSLRSLRWQQPDWGCRALNVGVALAAILLTAPLMLLIALLIKLSSQGPVVFRQDRVGVDRRTNGEAVSRTSRRSDDRGGNVFTMYKFRTMRADPQGTMQVWASKDDPRITGFGLILRATRLDELPQLVNVLKGDMNIVGPRPEQPLIFAELRDEIEEYRDRQRVLPGITGLAQVNQGYDTDLAGVRKKVDLDLTYIRHRSPIRDLSIMAKTLPVIVLRKVWT